MDVWPRCSHGERCQLRLVNRSPLWVYLCPLRKENRCKFLIKKKSHPMANCPKHQDYIEGAIIQQNPANQQLYFIGSCGKRVSGKSHCYKMRTSSPDCGIVLEEQRSNPPHKDILPEEKGPYKFTSVPEAEQLKRTGGDSRERASSVKGAEMMSLTHKDRELKECKGTGEVGLHEQTDSSSLTSPDDEQDGTSEPSEGSFVEGDQEEHTSEPSEGSLVEGDQEEHTSEPSEGSLVEGDQEEHTSEPSEGSLVEGDQEEHTSEPSEGSLVEGDQEEHTSEPSEGSLNRSPSPRAAYPSQSGISLSNDNEVPPPQEPVHNVIVLDRSPPPVAKQQPMSILIEPMPRKPDLKYQNEQFKVARTYQKLEQQLIVIQNMIKTQSAFLPDGGTQLRVQEKEIMTRMQNIKNPKISEKSEESIKRARQTIERSQLKYMTAGAVVGLHKALDGCPSQEVMAEEPLGLKVSLFPHQRHALAWMSWREEQSPSGGILADEMGLGKTLCIISLILSKKSNEATFDTKPGLKRSLGTLVVCPKSLMHQWESEIHKRVEPMILQTYIHHGDKRTDNPIVLARYDVVLTTYNLLGTEWNATGEAQDKPGTSKRISRSCPLFRVHWERVVLDEAHVIRNPSTAASQGAAGLTAYHRWCVTGTPIQNKLQDVFSLVRFLHLAPFDKIEVWKQHVEGRASQQVNKKGMERLNTIIKGLVLRRSKQDTGLDGKELVSLPTKHLVNHTIQLKEYEEALHKALFKISRADFVRFLHEKMGESTEEPTKEEKLSPLEEFMVQVIHKMKMLPQADNPSYTTNNSNLYSCILAYLIRLRQVCVHPFLVNKDPSLLDSCTWDHGDPTDEFARQLGRMTLEDTDGPSISQGTMPEMIEQVKPMFCINYISSRMDRLMEELRKIKRDSDDKCVVVSQWTSMLDIVEYHLTREGVTFGRIDGSVPANARQKLIEIFNSNTRSNPEVLTLSLIAGGVGLNLIGGNHLFICDLHWNPFNELQASDRVHRVGQTKEVYIHRFVCKGTIEERICKLQEFKKEMASNALSGAGANCNKLSVDDLKLLFQVD